MTQEHKEPIHHLLTWKLYSLITTLSITRTTVKGREYRRAYIKIPLDMAEEIAKDKRNALVVVLVGRASHLHALYWDEPDTLWERLDPVHRLELEILGNTAWSPEEVRLIPAKPEQLRELGLDPEEPLTLEDVVNAVKVKSQGDGPLPGGGRARGR